MPPTAKVVEVHTAMHFAVEIDGINQAAFTECTLPSLEVEVEELREGGQNDYAHHLPVGVKAGPVRLKHGITKDGELLKWYLQVVGGDFENAMRTVTIIMYAQDLTQVASWTFYRAYPVKWTGPTLKAGETAIAIEEIELVHHGFETG